jgi:hypothetical protein
MFATRIFLCEEEIPQSEILLVDLYYCHSEQYFYLDLFEHEQQYFHKNLSKYIGSCWIKMGRIRKWFYDDGERFKNEG